MNQHDPLDVVTSVSKRKDDWMRDSIDGETRLAIFFKSLLRLRRPTDISQSIFDNAVRASKLHDGEPETIVTYLESVCPDFFRGMPCRGEISLPKKKALVGECVRAYLKRGRRQYGKPTLRRDTPKLRDIK